MSYFGYCMVDGKCIIMGGRTDNYEDLDSIIMLNFNNGNYTSLNQVLCFMFFYLIKFKLK